MVVLVFWAGQEVEEVEQGILLIVLMVLVEGLVLCLVSQVVLELLFVV